MNYTIERHVLCVSTNLLAKERAREGAPAGTVIVADGQTEGRGTRGRRWFSPPGAGLYVSVVLRPDMDISLSLLPVAAGLAAREAVERAAGVPVRVRWPNDIVWERKKIGGVLCESGLSGFQLRYAIIGLGLNLDQKEDDFPPELRSSAGSLLQAAGASIEKETLLGAFLEELDAAVAPLIERRPSDVVEDFLRHAEAGIGDAVRIQTIDGAVSGLFEGLDADGSVRISTPQGPRRLVAAEIVSFGLAPL
jgi:BirA family transcriptional regulator, biotin operon repressor / biotin---[acetyl-CoA-carboxylase] ligase